MEGGLPGKASDNHINTPDQIERPPVSADKQLPRKLRRYRRRIFARLPEPLPTAWKWVEREILLRRGYPAPGLLINENEFRPQIQQALEHLQSSVEAENIGDFLEFGVGHGTSMRLMYEELVAAKLDHVRLFGFDSFAGLPFDDENEWEEGQFKVDYDEVVHTLRSHEIVMERVTLVKGFFQDTLNEEIVDKHGLLKASLIMVDCDLYTSAKEALAFCAPLILDEAIIFFDDWEPSAQMNKGEKRAFDEFLQNNPEFEAAAVGVYNLYPGDHHGKVFRLIRKTRD